MSVHCNEIECQFIAVELNVNSLHSNSVPTLQDVVDPVTDEMLAKFVPKGANIEDKSISISQEDPDQYSLHADPKIIAQDLLKKYITYAKLNVFPRLHDADMDKLTHVYAELRRESSL
ncbi:hypothetical protein Ancab_038351 [Ancistrocladus abbreviatus]